MQDKHTEMTEDLSRRPVPIMRVLIPQLVWCTCSRSPVSAKYVMSKALAKFVPRLCEVPACASTFITSLMMSWKRQWRVCQICDCQGKHVWLANYPGKPYHLLPLLGIPLHERDYLLEMQWALKGEFEALWLLKKTVMQVCACRVSRSSPKYCRPQL